MPKIALIAAFPPPITGQSLAADLLRNGLKKEGIPYFELDLSEPIHGEPVFERIWQLIGLECRLAVLCIRHRDLVVYLQLGHGKSALLRDLVFMATAHLFRRPCVAHVHGSGFRTAFEQLPKAVRAVEKHMICRLKAAVVLSKSLRCMFDSLLDEDRIWDVDNGIADDFVDLTMDSPERTVHSPMNVLFLSNFLTAKGFSVLLRAAVMAREAGKNIHFTFIGAKIAGQDVDIDEFVRDYKLDNVSVCDVVKGMEKHLAYQKADVFILPSVYEGQPLSILEAMFEALPVITTKVGGIPEIFSDETGVCYVSPESPEEIFKVLCELDNAPGRLLEMGKSNRRLAMERFTAAEHIRKMVNILGCQH